jgi:hypothetical protein
MSLALAVALAVLDALPCAAPRLRVEADLIDDVEDAAMTEYLHARVPPRLRRTCGDDPRAVVTVVVAWAEATPGTLALSLRASTADGRRESTTIDHTCDCSSPEVVDWIVGHTPDALAQIEPVGSPPRPTPVASPAARVPAPRVPRRGPASAQPERSTPGRGRPAGIALVALGGVGTIVGATLWGVGHVRYEPDPRLRRDLVPAGIAVTTAALSAVVTGAILIATARR